MARTIEHGDGRTYEGECLCHGNVVRGPVARSQPRPYLSQGLFAAPVRVVLLTTGTGAHDVPVAGIRTVG